MADERRIKAEYLATLVLDRVKVNNHYGNKVTLGMLVGELREPHRSIDRALQTLRRQKRISFDIGRGWLFRA